MITVRRISNVSFKVLNGHLRFDHALRSDGKVKVVDYDTHQIFWVHNLDGARVALTEGQQAALDAEVNAVINRARSR